MPLPDLRDLCVSRFLLSRTREPIMIGVENLIGDLTQHNIATEVWINGSFLTHKINPKDVDLVLCANHTVYDNGTLQQRQILEGVDQMTLGSDIHCESYVFYEYPQGHPLHAQGQFMRAYWMRQYGFGRDDQFKGIAVIDLV